MLDKTIYGGQSVHQKVFANSKSRRVNHSYKLIPVIEILLVIQINPVLTIFTIIVQFVQLNAVFVLHDIHWGCPLVDYM